MKYEPNLFIIGVVGKAGAGKSEACKDATDILGGVLPVKHMSMADSLKEALVAMGAPSDAIYGDQVAKNAPLELFGGKSARELMVTLGTEWGRQMISDTLWCDLFINRANEFARKHPSTLCVVFNESIRFLNEANVVYESGGQLIRIVRNGVQTTSMKTHASETEQDSIVCHHTIINDSTLGVMQKRFTSLCAQLVHREAVVRAENSMLEVNRALTG